MRGRIASDEFWYQIKDAFGAGGGIYTLSCVDENGTTIPIGRLLGEDPDGILYIGMAASFHDRVIDLKKSLSPKHVSRSHECGVRHKSHAGVSNRFPYDRLHLEMVSAADPRAAEREALQLYIDKFGELPPLNRVS